MKLLDLMRPAAVTLVVFAVTIACADEPAKPAQNLDSISETVLVERLGHPRYSVREQATRELKRRGRAVLPALRAGARSDDAEIRQRCESLLLPLLRAEFELLLESFEKGQKTSPESLPGWEAIRKVLGDDPGGRKLYASLARRDLPFLKKLEDNPKELTAEFPGGSERIALLKLARPDSNASFSDLWEIYRKAQLSGLETEIELLLRPALVRAAEGAARTGSPTSIREAFLVARLTKSLTEVQPSAREVIQRFCGDPKDLSQIGIALECARELPDEQKLIETKIRPAALKVLKAKDLPIDGSDYASVCSALQLVKQLQLREGVRYAIKAVQTDGRFAGIFRGQAILVISELAGPDDVAAIEPLLRDPTSYGVNTVAGKLIKTQFGDVCLARVVSITNQNPANYGFSFTGPPVNLWGFENEEQRQVAIKKWQAWRSRERK